MRRPRLPEINRSSAETIPGLRVFVRLGPDRIARLAAAVALVVALGTYMASVGWSIGAVGHDPEVYRAAGQRLNVGHSLYQLAEGDAPIPSNSPYWTGPLLSPPLSGAIWRPLATLPAEPTQTIWRLCGFALLSLTTLVMLRRTRWQGSIILFLAAPAYALTAFSGNLNAFIAPAMVLIWLLGMSKRDVGAGIAVAVGASLKLGPATLAVWLLAQRKWTALIAATATGVILAAATMVVAGPSIFLDYLNVARQATSEGAWPASIPGLLEGLNAPAGVVALSIPVALIVGSGLILATRRHATASFVIAVLLAIWSTPVVHLVAMSLLIAAAAPFAWSPKLSRPAQASAQMA